MLRFVSCPFLILFCILSCSCKKKEAAIDELPETSVKEQVVKKYTKFRGPYKNFNDLPDLHLSAAQSKGLKPIKTRADTILYVDKAIRLPEELDIYKMDKLTYSTPYLVDDAANLLIRIGLNFRDSLIRKKMPPYKIIVTSVTRTTEDVQKLTKRNSNASHNSAHTYATTFDISWRRFQKKGSDRLHNVSEDRLKLVLAEVLHDLRQRDKCYIMHERKQACFHITAR